MDVARVKLKWNNHHHIFSHYLQEYYNQTRFSDAMIACEGRILMVHRIILSTCSQYFEEIFLKAPNDMARPIIILNDTSVEVMEWLLTYVYCGEVTIPKDSLPRLFRLAEQLKVKGLSQLEVPESDRETPGVDVSESHADTILNKTTQKPLKRKLPDKSIAPAKKPASAEMPRYLPISRMRGSKTTASSSELRFLPIQPQQQMASVSIAPPTAPVAGSPLVLTSSVSSSLPSDIIVTHTPPTSRAGSTSTHVLPPASVNLPENTSSPYVTIPVSALPPGVQTSTSTSMPILASRLAKPTGVVSCIQSLSVPFPQSSSASANTTTFHSKAIMAGESTNQLQDNTSSDEFPLLTEIKEEVKEEPLILGPDDPMSMDDDEEDNKDDEDELSKICIMEASSVISEEQGKDEEEAYDIEVDRSDAGPVRSHVLPQTVPLKSKTHAKAIAKNSQTKFQQCQEPKKKKESVNRYKDLDIPNRKAFSPPNVPGNIDRPFHIKVVTKSQKSEKNQGDGSQPGKCNITLSAANSNNDSQNPYLEEDADLREMMEFIEEGSDNGPRFVPVDSDKKKNPPYLIRDTKIASKNGEPVKFCLRGGQVNQIVTVSMRYTEEKYKGSPVIACLLHSKENERSNFIVSSPVGNTVMFMNEEDGHPTAHMIISRGDMDVMSNFMFYVSFICLNSCHKENGKKMDLVCKLLDPATTQVLKQNNFEVRVCKNVKRDYKEIITGEQSQCLKLHNYAYPEEAVIPEEKNKRDDNQSIKLVVRPDTFLYPEEDGESTTQGSGSIALPGTETLTALGKKDNQKHDLFLLRLPNSKRGKVVLDLVREFEKAMLNIHEAEDQETN